MADYQAPIRDMQFVLNELIPLSSINSLPSFEDATDDLVSAILEEASKFATGVLSPLNWTGDREGSVLKDGKVTTPKGFRDAYLQYAEAGWIGLGGDPAHGGQGLPSVVATAVNEMWHASNMAFTLCPMLTAGAIDAIEHHGSDDQKSTYLEKLMSGQWAGTMNLTEPNAGSDLSVVATKATPEGSHYRVKGTKIYITYGEHDFTENIIHLVLARLPDSPAGVKGISLFIVPKFLVNADGSLGERNDVKCISIEHKLGIHASPTAVMSYGEGPGAIGYLVGEANRGLEYMFTMMNNARHAVGLEGVGISERAYQHAMNYALQRVQGRIVGKQGNLPIAYHPDVSRMLMMMRSQIHAMRAVAYLASAEADRARKHPDESVRTQAQSRVDFLIPIVKAWSTEQAIEITSLGVQVHGGMGYVEETGAAQHFRDARITTIYEGTTAIQANDLLGRKLLRDKGAEAAKIMAEMRAVAKELSAHAHADLQVMGKKLDQAVASLESAVTWTLKNYAANPAAAFMSSYPLLKCFGVVCGAWMLGRSSLIAAKHLAAGTGDPFYAQKIAVSLFYTHHVLSGAAGLAETVCEGDSAMRAAEIGLGDSLEPVAPAAPAAAKAA